jgi:hypothetical protein
MSYIVLINQIKKKTKGINPVLSDMFNWCSENCSKEYGKDGRWGSSWWTENNNTEFHFVDERDALLFRLRWA